MPAFTRAEFEDFLYREARLLDQRKFDEWLALFCGDGRYEVPSPGLPSEADPGSSLFLIADNREALEFRVERSLAQDNHTDYPAADTARMISNVEVLSDRDGITEVGCVFQTTQASNREIRSYHGRHFYRFENGTERPSILLKKTFIAQPDLRLQGRLSTIV